MKLQRISKVSICTTFMLIFSSGCISSRSYIPPTDTTVTRRVIPSLTLTVTRTSSLALPISTLKIEPTHTPENTPTEFPPTQTPTIGPTMTAEERKKFVQELLQTNAGCELPCWWGIVPGKTRWHESLKFLQALGVRVGSNPPEDGAVFHGTGGFDFEEDHIFNRVGFRERKGIVESVYIHSEGYANEIGFQDLWSHYSPKNLIPKYGSPSRVWIKSTSNYWGNTGYNGYTLWLFYDQLGFVVKYSGGVKYQPIYHFCPSMENEKDIGGIEFLLQSPENLLPLDRIDEQDALFLKYVRNIEEAAGISLDQFAQLFTDEDQSGCFDIPANIFSP